MQSKLAEHRNDLIRHPAIVRSLFCAGCFTPTRWVFTVVSLLIFLAAGQRAAAFDVGERVEVLSYGAWFEAEILEVGDGQCLVHYLDWDSSWDEWVPNAAIRYPATVYPPATPERGGTATTFEDRPAEIPFRPAENYEYRVGDEVEVRSGGGGFVHRAEIVEADGDRFLIRYDGYESTEWTGPERIRLPEEGAVWDALMYRFHYDVGVEGTLGYFQHETPAPAGEYDVDQEQFDHEVLIHKRETLFGRIDRYGRVSVGDHLLGRVTIKGETITVRRNGRTVGSILADGTIRRDTVTLAKMDQYGELVDPAGRSIGGIDARTGYMIGYWGYASHTEDELDRKLVAAFLFFFTELPHAIELLVEN